MEEAFIPVMPGQKFKFGCGPSVSCFNDCCHDLNQFLTPYDIICLKNSLGITSTEFLAKYTTRHAGEQTGLPVIALLTDPATDLACIFLTENGCGIYDARPSSCRMYPLARLARRDRQSGVIREEYMVIRESFCMGHGEGEEWTSEAWIENQGLALYNEMNDIVMEIISLKNVKMPGALDLRSSFLIETALYDLDRFKTEIVEGESFDAPPEMIEAARNDDVELFKLAVEWLKKTVF